MRRALKNSSVGETIELVINDRHGDFKFINQHRVIEELTRYFRAISQGSAINLLVYGRSGYGKTTLVLNLAKKYFDKYAYYPTGRFISLGSSAVTIIDEAHLLKRPEITYYFLDNKRNSYIFCTNTLEFPEAFLNRNYIIVLDRYTPDHIAQIIKQYFPDVDSDVARESAHKLLLNPRITKNTCERLIHYFGKKALTTEDFIQGLKDLGFKNYEPLTQAYIDYLQKVRRSSIQRIAAGTGISREYIENFIEPFLIEQGILEIGSFGRRIA